MTSFSLGIGTSLTWVRWFGIMLKPTIKLPIITANVNLIYAGIFMSRMAALLDKPLRF